MLTSIVGINWGDEGKGRMVDLLSQKYDVVVRYQGGNNAGHTVINDKGKFVLNLMPSGILRDETVNVLGPGMVIDTEHMFHEVEHLRAGGITITPEHLKISDKAVICMPYHKLLDCLEEDRLADKKFGSPRLLGQVHEKGAAHGRTGRPRRTQGPSGRHSRVEESLHRQRLSP